MSQVLIRASKLSKRYKLYQKPSGRLLEWASLGRAKRHEDFWALNGFDLEVERGHCVGIIGPNGAGKTTLLRLLSRTLVPTSGSFEIVGRTLSLLELGTGFSTELTGRQNVIETAALLGFPREETARRLPEIIDFAGLGEFFDRPIRIYSSGMYVRLAFSMFACLKPDLFIVDEALAVGDVAFQRKCYDRLEQMRAAGTTCLLVTHDLQAVVRFCDRAVVLVGGNKLFEGSPRDATNLLNKMYFGEAPSADESRDYGDGGAEIEEVWFENSAGERIASGSTDEPFVFCYTVRFNKAVENPVCGFHCRTLHGVDITLAQSNSLGYDLGSFTAGQRLTLRWSLEPYLIAGNYFFGCGCRYAYEERFMARRVDAVRFPITQVSAVGGLIDPIRDLRLQRDGGESVSLGRPKLQLRRS